MYNLIHQATELKVKKLNNIGDVRSKYVLRYTYCVFPHGE